MYVAVEILKYAAATTPASNMSKNWTTDYNIPVSGKSTGNLFFYLFLVIFVGRRSSVTFNINFMKLIIASTSNM